MPSLTRAQVRAEVGARMDGSYLSSTPTATGTTSTLIDTVRLQDTGASTDRHAGCWIGFTAGALAVDAGVRRVLTDTPSTGTLTHGGPVWSTAPTTAMPYELYGLLDPRDLNDCINRALQRATRRRQEQFTVTDPQQLQYVLTTDATFVGAPDMSYLQSPQDVMRILTRSGATANQYGFREVPRTRYELREDDDGITLDLRGGFDTVNAYVLEVLGPYATLSTDAATTSCPRDWLVALTMQSAWERYGHIIDNANRPIRMLREDVAKEVLAQTMRFAPRRYQRTRLRFS